MQESITLWEGFIRCSGGAIRPDKIHWYLIDFEWEDGEWFYKQPQPTDPILYVRNKKGVQEKIERVPPNKGRRTVGVQLQPDGNNQTELAYLTEQIGIWCDRAKSHRLPRHMVWTSLTTGIMRKLAYPLPATTFTKQECYDLLTPLLKVALPTVGINRHFPRLMLHAPLSVKGWALQNPYVEQGLGHLQ